MIFVTGGTGLVGARLIYDLLVKGQVVRAIRRPESNLVTFNEVLRFYHGQDITTLLESLEWVEGDILDITSLEDNLDACTHCVHAAAKVSFHSKDHQQMLDVNVQGTANVVNACILNSVRLGYISSVAALGRNSSVESIDEMSTWKDSPYNTAYAVSKYRAEMEVWRGIEEGLDAVMVNPSIVLGAGPISRSSGTLFGVVRKGLKFYTDGGASVVDVRDVSAIMLTLLESELSSERFITNAASISYRSLFDEISDKMGKKKPSIHVGTSALHVAWRVMAVKDFLFGTRSPVTRETAMSSRSRYEYSSAKIKNELDFSFTTWQDSIAYYASFYNQSSF